MSQSPNRMAHSSRADLVDLDQDRMAIPCQSVAQQGHVGTEHVVTDELDLPTGIQPLNVLP
jgi:hypothetical protein